MGLSVSFSASRTTGIGETPVLFNAWATTDTVTEYPAHQCAFLWDFGANVSGSWTPTGIAKRFATGPVTACIFPIGTHQVTLTVYNGVEAKSEQVTITISDPADELEPVAFSTSGDFSGAPAGATHTSSDFDEMIATHKGQGKWLVFCGGETFTASALSPIDVTGPMIVGKYGTGKPIIQASGNFDIIRLSTATTACSDVTLVDLEIDGNANATARGVGAHASGTVSKASLIRLDIHDVNYGLSFAGTGDTYSEIALVDSGIDTLIGGTSYGAFLLARDGMLIGNTVDGSNATAATLGHGIRIPHLAIGAIHNNSIGAGQAGGVNLKLHAPVFTADEYTEKVVLSANKFPGGLGGSIVNIEPQNNVSDERLRDIIMERSLVTAGSGTNTGSIISGERIQLRNNITNLTGGDGGNYVCYSIAQRGVEPEPKDIWLFNNNGYSDDASTAFRVIQYAADVDGPIAKNNLGYAPNVTTPVLIRDLGAVNGVAGNNSSDAEVKATDPWVDHVDFVPDFDHGEADSTVLNWQDYLGNFRGATKEMGAVEVGIEDFPEVEEEPSPPGLSELPDEGGAAKRRRRKNWENEEDVWAYIEGLKSTFKKPLPESPQKVEKKAEVIKEEALDLIEEVKEMKVERLPSLKPVEALIKKIEKQAQKYEKLLEQREKETQEEEEAIQVLLLN